MPMTKERLTELIGLLEEMETGGDTSLTLEQASDIHDFLEQLAARPASSRWDEAALRALIAKWRARNAEFKAKWEADIRGTAPRTLSADCADELEAALRPAAPQGEK